MIPYPHWLNAGDNAWQLTAATLVGLMSIPALAVLYGGIVQRKWAINTMMMVFSAFALTLIVWMLWAFKMGFGSPWLGTFLGRPGTVVGATSEQARASIPLLDGVMPKMRFPESSLVYFQFVFAAITPILFIGSVLGRIRFQVWLIFVPLWITFAYGVTAFMLWGGGFWASRGALDYSGGYVIHLAAGVSGFVAAAVVGPRLRRDRDRARPNNLIFVAAGAGLLWLGWNGFNGGDPYFAGADAAAAVLNTNLAAAVAMMTWVIMDMAFGRERRPTFLGGVNGLICGLVAITPAAGYVNGVGAMLIGLTASSLVWVAFTYLPRKVWPFTKVDDALGVVYTHGFAGLAGGLMVGLLADPKMVVYLGAGKGHDVTTAGLFYGHPGQLLVQAGAAGTVIVWDGLVTFLILRGIGLFMKLRMSEAELIDGDVRVHGEVAYPLDAAKPAGEVGAARVGVGELARRRAAAHGDAAGPADARLPESDEPELVGAEATDRS
ncbi:MAG TPA: ammonium transporter [Streptosporangiaceae bacterium]|nr:ammonium transporter [Streptosporangiaceae bacterium]